MVQAVARRADALLARLEDTTTVLDKAARVQLRILEKLEPIVDDLGVLVRAQLAQTLGRPGRDGGRDDGRAQSPRDGRSEAERARDDEVIDVTDE
jgi:hypothetical protein